MQFLVLLMLLGLLGLLVNDVLQRLNALKNVMAGMVNGIAAVLFAFAAHVNWVAALALAVGTVVGGLSHAMEEMRDGRYDVEIPSTDRADEIGVMARAPASFRDNLVRMEAMEAEQKKSEARLVSRRRAEMQRLADSFEAAVGNIVRTVSGISARGGSTRPTRPTTVSCWFSSRLT